MTHKALRPFPTERPAKRHQMNADASVLARNGGKFLPAHLSEHRLLHDVLMKKRRERITTALLAVLAFALWFGIGALAGVQI